MKRIVLASLFTSGLMAAESGMYVGMDVGNTAVDLKATVNGTSETVEDDGGSQTLKVGYYVDKNNRIVASFQNVNVDGGKARNYSIGYDYLIGNNAFKPFVGVFAGYGSLTVDSVSSLDIAGGVLGAQMGLNYAISENFSAEVGYRYMKSSMDDSISGPGGTAAFEVDPIKNWFIGVNYKF